MSKLKTGIIVGASLLAVASTSALIGNIYKEDITNWWNETFKKESNDKKYLSVGDKITKNTVFEVDLVKLVEYIRDKEEPTSNDLFFLQAIDGVDGSTNSSITLVEFNVSDGFLFIDTTSDSVVIYNDFDPDCSIKLSLSGESFNSMIESIGTIKLHASCDKADDFVSSEITSIIGVTLDKDGNVTEDLGIVKIYESTETE